MKFHISTVIDVRVPPQMDGEPYHVFITRAREYVARELRQTIAENNHLMLVSASKPRKVD